MLPSDTTNHSTLLKCRPRSQMICCCTTVHSYHELLETRLRHCVICCYSKNLPTTRPTRYL